VATHVSNSGFCGTNYHALAKYQQNETSDFQHLFIFLYNDLQDQNQNSLCLCVVERELCLHLLDSDSVLKNTSTWRWRRSQVDGYCVVCVDYSSHTNYSRC